MSTSPLDKFLKQKTETPAQVQQQPAKVLANVSSESQSSALAALMNKAKNRTGTTAAVQQAVKVQGAKNAEQEIAQIESAKTVPAEIYTLSDDIKKIEGFNADNMANLLASTYTALVEDEPRLPRLLEEINTNMRQYEELCYLLTPEQLGLYVEGCIKYMNLSINTTKPKASAAKNQQALVRETGGELQLL